MTRHDIPFYRVPVSRGGWGQPICTIEWSSPRVPLNLEGVPYMIYMDPMGMNQPNTISRMCFQNVEIETVVKRIWRHFGM